MTHAANDGRVAGARRYSFGGTAGIVTSVGLIVGFTGAAVSKGVMVGGLLIIALADNITDSLSIHIYQEAENLEGRSAFRATLTNFVARLLVASSFVALVVALPIALVPPAAIGWGLLLLTLLTLVLSRERNVSASREVAKHLLIAVLVIALSRLIGAFIVAWVSRG